jgi:hypothetical protein
MWSPRVQGIAVCAVLLASAPRARGQEASPTPPDSGDGSAERESSGARTALGWSSAIVGFGLMGTLGYLDGSDAPVRICDKACPRDRPPLGRAALLVGGVALGATAYWNLVLSKLTPDQDRPAFAAAITYATIESGAYFAGLGLGELLHHGGNACEGSAVPCVEVRDSRSAGVIDLGAGGALTVGGAVATWLIVRAYGTRSGARLTVIPAGSVALLAGTF